MLASTRRISLCIFCISGSTPDNDASAGRNKAKATCYPRRSEQQRSSIERIAAAASRAKSPCERGIDDSNSSRVHTSGEHLVDVLEGAGLVHFLRRDLSPARPRCKDLGRSKDLEGEGVEEGPRSGGAQAAGCRWRVRWAGSGVRGGIAGGDSPASTAARPFNRWRPVDVLCVSCCC